MNKVTCDRCGVAGAKTMIIPFMAEWNSHPHCSNWGKVVYNHHHDLCDRCIGVVAVAISESLYLNK